ncbi:MAG: Vacuolar H+transporting two-sector ATPase F subunit [Pseudomonas stutzeri]|nr:Vacuolar H+transporting two-sector ATPase F subunit [Stutzerimonas stutzeri]NIS58623.1 Vacuolar H+transporting two-sector ATPase F subunit [Stutzerimonas stutzeri]
MSVPIFIGDEVSACAYRLAGIEVRTPVPGELSAMLEQACTESHLVLITAQYAQQLRADELAKMQARMRPLLLVVPDVCEQVPVPDFAKALRSQLGVEA